MNIGETVLIKEGFGGWDITSHPIGGKFVRFSHDTACVIKRDYQKEGYSRTQTHGTRYVVEIENRKYAVDSNAILTTD